MNWVWNKKEVMKAWQSLVAVAERKSQNPALGFVRVQADGNQLFLKSTDLDVQLDYELDHPALEPGACLIPARKFWDICRSLPDDLPMCLKVEEQEKIRLTIGKSRFTLATLPLESYPALPAFSAGTEAFEISAQDLKSLLDSVSFAASDQDSRLYLNGILWIVESERLVVVASDGHRLIEASLPLALQEPFQKRVIVPRRSVMDMGRLLSSLQDKSVRVEFSESSLAIKTVDFCLTVRLIDSRYPEHEKFFPPRMKHQITIPFQPLKQALQRISILTDHHEIVALAFSENHLELRTDNPGHEEAVEELSVSYSGPEWLLRLNIRYWMDFLNAIGSDLTLLQMSFSSADSAIVFEGDPAFHVRYVLMPFRR